MAADFDIVLWGATGFVGRLTALHLARTQSTHQARWAIGGRDEAKLKRLRDSLSALHAGCAALPILVADAHDAAALHAIASRTKVLASAVGPYAQHGSELVAAAAQHGSAYCDLTGEVPWIRRMIDAHHQRAVESGARIVHACGFESIPADLGVLLLQEHMMKRHGAVCTRIDCSLGPIRGGGISGGTSASLLQMFDALDADVQARRLFADPYSLDPEPGWAGATELRQLGVVFNQQLGAWTGPSLTAALDLRIVHRTHALLGYPWGRDFRFVETTNFGTGPAARLLANFATAAMSVGSAALDVKRFRQLLAKVAPAPGQGPSQKALDSGSFVFEYAAHGRSPAGRQIALRARMSGQGDPGYACAARMLGESALSLAFDEPRQKAGVLTPATGLGSAVWQRLARHGFTFAIRE